MSDKSPVATPEVDSVSSLLLHPVLQDPKFLAALVGLLLIFVLYSVFRPGNSQSSSLLRNGVPNVLLVGPSDSGKTALFAKVSPAGLLSQNTLTQTHTSVLPSSTTFALSPPSEPEISKPIRLVDLPGHPRLRDIVRTQLKQADGVVFVVDIQGIVRNGGAIAEELPPILTILASLSLRRSSPLKLMILAHKTDLLIRPTPTGACPTIPSATRLTAVDRARSILTREMDRLKSARGAVGGRIEGMGRVASSSGGSWWSRLFGGGAGVASTSSDDADGDGEDDEALVWGGKGGFRWEDVEGVDIEWGSSALGSLRELKDTEAEGEGLAELKEWIASV